MEGSWCATVDLVLGATEVLGGKKSEFLRATVGLAGNLCGLLVLGVTLLQVGLQSVLPFTRCRPASVQAAIVGVIMCTGSDSR